MGLRLRACLQLEWGPWNRTGTQYARSGRKCSQGHHHQGNTSRFPCQYSHMRCQPMAPLQVAPCMSPTTHPDSGVPLSSIRRERSGAVHMSMWQGHSYAVGAGSLSSHTFFPADSHSRYLQEAFIANTCQVFSINIQPRTFFTRSSTL